VEDIIKFEHIEIMDTNDMLEHINDVVTQFIQAKFKEATASQLNLDTRCGSTFYVNDEYIVIPLSQKRTLDYYGGFEYVDQSYVKTLGDWVFYNNGDDRVEGHISIFLDQYENSDDESDDA
jgi:hypothetical protein